MNKPIMADDSDHELVESKQATPDAQHKTLQDRIGQSVSSITGTKVPELAMHLAGQLSATIQNDKDGVEGHIERFTAALASISEFKPRDEIERKLIAQMIATHEAGMECFRRAMIRGQTFEGRDMNLKHAEKLASIYVRQVEALDKHRGKGKQTITVKHVNVHPGGQAIVGDVTAGKSENPQTSRKRRAPALGDDTAASSSSGEDLREALKPKKSVKGRATS